MIIDLSIVFLSGCTLYLGKDTYAAVKKTKTKDSKPTEKTRPATKKRKPLSNELS
jgi:hypothetical protein